LAEQYSLTDLELRILRLVTEGLSNDEIAQLTNCARETIKGHLKSLFRKLDVKNRTEAAVLAIRQGLK
jgi:two-component system NarL family response regulator